ncbi:hypothetical protein K8I85_01935, partial [bacterium]|nr:hypothetical protein [bacterium]
MHSRAGRARQWGAATAMALLSPFPPEAAAATWIVDQGGTGDATTIQAAVDLATSGDEILIQAGTYTEAVDSAGPLSFVGLSGREFTIIDAEAVREYCLHASGSGTRLEGLTFTGVDITVFSWDCVGRDAISVTGEIRDCAIVGNRTYWEPVQIGEGTAVFNTRFVGNSGVGKKCWEDAAASVGGCIGGGPSLWIEGCEFEGNWGTSIGVLFVVGSAEFRRCRFRNNGAPQEGQFTALGHVSLRLFDSVFLDNHGTMFGGASYGATMDLEVEGNTFARNQTAFLDEPTVLTTSRFHANVFTGAEVGLHLPTGKPNEVTCNVAFGNEANWIGFDPEPGGNLSAPPLYCLPDLDDFTVASNSPLLAANNACGIN